MKKQKTILFIIPILIISILGIVIYVSKNQEELLYCDAVTPRGNDLEKWQETIAPKQDMEKLNTDFFNEIKVTSDANNLTVEYPSANPPESPFPYEIREMSFDLPLEIGEGTLKFSGLGVAFRDVNFVPNNTIPYKYFDAQFQPANEETISNIWQYTKYESQSSFQYYAWPFVNFAFEYEGIEDVMFNGMKVFDARTHKLLSSGYSSSTTNSFYKPKVNIPIWHNAPIDLVLDVSFGPSKIFNFPAREGEGFEYEGFECRVINISEDVDSHTTMSSSRANSVTFEMPKTTTGDGSLCFLFACQPNANKMPLTLSFLDKDGQGLSGNGGSSTSGLINNISLKQPRENVAFIQAKYRTNRYRIIIHLPYIPGLPEQNQNIENLFDVYIPYVTFNSPDRLNSFLYKTLQLNRSNTSGKIPSQNTLNNPYPIIFTDVTVRDIIKTNTAGATINVNLENDNLEIKYPEPFLTKLKLLFYRIKSNN